MVHDEAVLQHHGEVEDAGKGRDARAVGQKLRGLVAVAAVQKGDLHQDPLALQHLHRLHLLPRAQAPAVAPTPQVSLRMLVGTGMVFLPMSSLAVLWNPFGSRSTQQQSAQERVRKAKTGAEAAFCSEDRDVLGAASGGSLLHEDMASGRGLACPDECLCTRMKCTDIGVCRVPPMVAPCDCNHRGAHYQHEG